jgi:DNA-binding NtrC family response regulator
LVRGASTDWRQGKTGILIVDDEKSVLETYAMILEKKGYAVETAISSTAAISILDERNIDILLCDYSLEQEHTGFEVIDHARRRKPQMKCLLITGYASLETADEAKRKNIQVLYKPIDIAQFFQTIESLMKADYEPYQSSAEEGRAEEGAGKKVHSEETEKRDKPPAGGRQRTRHGRASG